MLAPVSGLVHAGPQLVANRYSYLSCLGWALLIGAGVCVAVRAGTGGALRSSYARLPVIAATLWIAGLAGLSLDQIRVWRDTDTLWRSALDADPRCDFCHANLGAALEKRGLYGAAIEHFETALALRPDYAIGAHTAALGLAYYSGDTLSAPFRNGMFIGQHGSWNRSEYSGYKVIFVPFKEGRPDGLPVDVLTGFLRDDGSGKAYGRPVGVVVDKAGALLVADDVGNTVWRVTGGGPARPSQSR